MAGHRESERHVYVIDPFETFLAFLVAFHPRFSLHASAWHQKHTGQYGVVVWCAACRYPGRRHPPCHRNTSMYMCNKTRGRNSCVRSSNRHVRITAFRIYVIIRPDLQRKPGIPAMGDWMGLPNRPMYCPGASSRPSSECRGFRCRYKYIP
jgi:hypothetical protein